MTTNFEKIDSGNAAEPVVETLVEDVHYAALLEEIAKPQYYNNRELSWLAFNERVLEEAEDEENIYESNRIFPIF